MPAAENSLRSLARVACAVYFARASLIRERMQKLCTNCRAVYYARWRNEPGGDVCQACRVDVVLCAVCTMMIRPPSDAASWLTFAVGTPLHDVERRLIEATLRTCNGDRNLAASLLGITARTIYRREAEWRGG